MDSDRSFPVDASDQESAPKHGDEPDSRCSRESQLSPSVLSEAEDEESSAAASKLASSPGTAPETIPDTIAATAPSHDRHVKKRVSKEQYDMMRVCITTNVSGQTLRAIVPLCHKDWALFLTNEILAQTKKYLGSHPAVLAQAREDAKIAQLKATILELERQEQELLHSIRCSLCKLVAPASPDDASCFVSASC